MLWQILFQDSIIWLWSFDCFVMFCFSFNVYQLSQRKLVWANTLRFFPGEITFSGAKTQSIPHSLLFMFFFYFDPSYKTDVFFAFWQSFLLWPAQQLIILEFSYSAEDANKPKWVIFTLSVLSNIFSTTAILVSYHWRTCVHKKTQLILHLWW